MLFLTLPLLLIGGFFQDYAIGTETIKSTLPEGEYLLDTHFSGKVSSATLPKFCTSSQKLPKPFRDWSITFDRVKVTSKKTMVFHPSDVTKHLGRKSAILLEAIPDADELALLTKISEFKSLFGNPQDVAFPDFGTSFSVENGETTFRSSSKWVVCCLDSEETIKYLRIVLYTDKTNGEVSIADRWIQQAALKKISRGKLQGRMEDVIKISGLAGVGEGSRKPEKTNLPAAKSDKRKGSATILNSEGSKNSSEELTNEKTIQDE